MNLSLLNRSYSQLKWINRLHKSSRALTTKNDSPLRYLLEEASTYGETGAKNSELQWATEPYTQRPHQEEAVQRLAPEESSVVLFPGQGSQFVGMGRQLVHIPAATELYQLASSVVGWDVWRVCTEGPPEELARRVQTCIVVTSLAALERARAERPGAVERARAAAGFSLGELTALVFAGALPLEPALRLVELRQAAMSAAAAERPGGMLTVWLAADADLPRLLRQARDHAAERGVADPLCEVANYLYPNCKVLAGDEEALRFVASNGRALGVKRVASVAAEGALHTAHMRRAGEALRAGLNALRVGEPRLRVVSALDARAVRGAGGAARALAAGVAAPVRWEQTLHALYARRRGERFPLTLALGPGGAVRATLRQVNARAWDSSVQIDV